MILVHVIMNIFFYQLYILWQIGIDFFCKCWNKQEVLITVLSGKTYDTRECQLMAIMGMHYPSDRFRSLVFSPRGVRSWHLPFFFWCSTQHSDRLFFSLPLGLLHVVTRINIITQLFLYISTQIRKGIRLLKRRSPSAQILFSASPSSSLPILSFSLYSLLLHTLLLPSS